jgi:uncharacterized protein
MDSAVISRSFRSFIDAYQPDYGFFITKDFNQKMVINNCKIHFISFTRLIDFFAMLKEIL